MDFRGKLGSALSRNQSLLCVGLDPKDVPAEAVAAFNCAIIDATKDLVCAYKPNLAIYERLGGEGIRALEDTLKAIPSDIPVIGDGKRGDIENCGEAYLKRLFEGYGFDAVTVNPYMGREAIVPFLEWDGGSRGIFVLCRTSNLGGSEVQELSVIGRDGAETPFYMEMARLAHEWDTYGNVGLVVGATAPDALKAVRKSYPDTPILVPGVGAQGGPLEAAVENGMDRQGHGLIVNISRSVIYALSQDPSDLENGRLDGYARFAAAARQAAEEFRYRINRVRQAIPVRS